MIDLEHKLNPQQCLTARETEGAFLVIAGAGSGKTRTITYRIANMLDKGIPQSAILALTFTNKAAREMADRVKELVGRKLPMLTVSTFHAFGVRVLRESISHLGYKENFSIYDQADKMALIKETARSLKIDPADLNLYDLANLFSDIKTGRARWDADSSQYSPIYDEYNELLKLYNAVDFDDLIVLPIKLFKEKPDVLEKYRKRYRYIMVDEFQDTSKIQYDLVYLLAQKSKNICVVGDDDQSIYSWRGANYENIVQFEKDFPEIKEAQFIAETITLLRMKDDLSYGDFGILVRTNSLTTAIEDALLMNGIPYAVSGGQSFFQRKEIKDIIAYLRVITNPDDDISLLRIINTPRRGIGKKALEQITELGKKEKCSVFAAMQKLDKYEDFVNMITAYKGKFLSGKNLAATLNALVDEIHYWDHLITEYQKNEKEAKWKYKNILTFISLLDRWEQENEEEESIYSYLNKITLITRDDDQDTEGGKVGLMTIHAAKGLEFKVVFLAGCEDAIIPHARALEEDPSNIEEERRLFYVAVTRAMDKLYITSCRMRHHLRDCVTCIPSRFLEEIPAELIQNGEEEKEETPEEATKRMLEQFEKLRARWK